MDYHYGIHTVYNIAYHLVWVTKYRYQVLKGDISLGVRELVRQMTEEMIKNYLDHHSEANPNNNFKTEYGELK
ncbi:transposase [Bathymodiolus japonicus methanotrophic gill symbiont]|uniref:transposase n=1 Tax=Bathymodiolus japonicus methanotrophic gill symbiont TaxID=113269 RepID=UPI001C8EA72F|nr:transposase [Bathymodiolus japonicus methanotrophic gill symbiont]